jgi:hypothetical protein
MYFSHVILRSTHTQREGVDWIHTNSDLPYGSGFVFFASSIRSASFMCRAWAVVASYRVETGISNITRVLSLHLALVNIYQGKNPRLISKANYVNINKKTSMYSG